MLIVSVLCLYYSLFEVCFSDTYFTVNEWVTVSCKKRTSLEYLPEQQRPRVLWCHILIVSTLFSHWIPLGRCLPGDLHRLHSVHDYRWDQGCDVDRHLPGRGHVRIFPGDHHQGELGRVRVLGSFRQELPGLENRALQVSHNGFNSGFRGMVIHISTNLSKHRQYFDKFKGKV